MSASFWSQHLGAISATASRPQAPSPVHRVDRSLHVIGEQRGSDVSYFSAKASALAGDEAARSDASSPVDLYAPGVRFDAYA